MAIRARVLCVVVVYILVFLFRYSHSFSHLLGHHALILLFTVFSDFMTARRRPRGNGTSPISRNRGSRYRRENRRIGRKWKDKKKMK